jgi:ABC-2 type transport system permease protein
MGGLTAYLAMEVVVFRETYPTAASQEQLRRLSSSSVVRMMQGDPGGLDSAGGFAVWDAGWVVLLVVGAWTLLSVTRLTRGEEDAGRADLVLSRPVAPEAHLRAALAALLLGSAGLGAACALPLLLLGQQVEGALLWGAGVAAFTAVMASLGALVAQLVGPRRRAASVGFALLVGAYLARVVAHSADDRSWLLAVTPFGWTDRLAPFDGNRWAWLLAPVLTALLLGAAAVLMSARRDTGSALLHDRADHRTSTRLLGSAPAFGWRLTQPALLAWAATLGVLGVVFGLMTDALLELLAEDDSYRSMLEALGVDLSEPLVGFLGYLAVSIAVTVAAFTGFRLGAVRQEEAEGRLDALLVRGVVRRRWLATTAVHALLSAVLLIGVSGLAVWAGAQSVGAPVTAGQVLEPMAGTVPLLVVFVGVAVLAFGAAPRLTTVLPVTLAVATYLLDTLGTALSWPSWTVTLSPFHHLARLPGDPMTAGAALGLTTLGVLLAAAGLVAFDRRDVGGA